MLVTAWGFKAKQQQGGYILVFVLMVFVIVYLIGIVLLKVAFLEMKQSEYSLKTKQAGQASMAGIEGTMESIYTLLCSQADIEELPHIAFIAGGPFLFSPDNSYFYIIEPEGAVLQDYSDNSCIYNFVCTGWASGCPYRIKTTCEYRFDQFYEDDGAGEKKFIKRVFLNRGQIIKSEYEIYES